MGHPTSRRRPTAYAKAGKFPVVLSTGRGDTVMSPAEGVAAGRDLIAVACGLDPTLGPSDRDLLLALADRVWTQHEILQATAARTAR